MINCAFKTIILILLLYSCILSTYNFIKKIEECSCNTSTQNDAFNAIQNPLFCTNVNQCLYNSTTTTTSIPPTYNPSTTPTVNPTGIIVYSVTYLCVCISTVSEFN